MANYDQYARLVNDQQASPTIIYPGPIYISAGGANAAGAATKYLAAPGQNHAAAQVVLAVLDKARVARNLKVVCVTAPGGADTYIVTVQKSVDSGATWTNTTLTATVTGAGFTASDTTNAPAFAAGALVAVKVVSSAVTAANSCVTFELD